MDTYLDETVVATASIEDRDGHNDDSHVTSNVLIANADDDDDDQDFEDNEDDYEDGKQEVEYEVNEVENTAEDQGGNDLDDIIIAEAVQV